MRTVLRAAVVLASLCFARSNPPAGDADEAMAERPAPVVDARFAPLRLPTVDGARSFDLPGAARGPTLVLAFAAWDATSRRLVDAWDDATREARAAHELQLFGVALDQHPERAELFALDHDLDWPVLWDPFDLLEIDDVPRAWLLDGEGRVRAVDPAPDAWRAALVDASDASADGVPPFDEEAAARAFGISEEETPFLVPQLFDATPGSSAASAWRGLSRLLLIAPWAFDAASFEFGLGALQAYVDRHPDDTWARFRLGVGWRMRFDRSVAQPGDFESALACWRAASARRPRSRVFAERAEQYGPQPDGDEAPYGWIDAAAARVAARGVSPPHAFRAPTAGERGRVPPDAARPPAPRDPTDAQPADDSWFTVEVVVVPAAGTEVERTRVHLGVVPDEARDVAWCNPDGPLEARIEAASLPEGWSIEQAVLVAGDDPAPRSQEARWVEFGLVHPPGASGRVRVTVLVPAAADGGACRLLRRDVDVALP